MDQHRRSSGNSARNRPASPPPARTTPAPEAPGVPARRAALRLLDAVLRRGQSLEAALVPATRDLPQANDRALARALAAEVLRRLVDLDALIDSATRLPLPPDAKARSVLRLALAQVLVLGTPPHAAIATVLPLVDGGPRKLVHGVFGTLMRQNATLPEAATLPPEAARRWTAAWGEAAVAAAGRALAVPPPLDLAWREPADPLMATMAGESLLPGHLRLARGGAVSDLPGYADGRWWVQDVAASIPARLLGRPTTGSGRALDLCAAPGGKTMQLAAAGWQVTAVDRSESRLARLGDNLSRVGLDVEVVTADLREWAPTEPADAVLLDAPCSATGIYRRHPDVLHRVTPAIIAEMAALQRVLLARAVDWVQPGGRLVYATCSLEPEEGEAQLARLLVERPDLTIEAIAPDELPAGLAVEREGWLRTRPGSLADQGGCDGFFVARLRRQA